MKSKSPTNPTHVKLCYTELACRHSDQSNVDMQWSIAISWVILGQYGSNCAIMELKDEDCLAMKYNISSDSLIQSNTN